MRGFENPPQFNPEKEPNQPSSQVVKNSADKSVPSKIKRVIEGAKDHLKYRGLKVKEYLGQLNQEEFDQLLEFDFLDRLKDTPSIKGVFSPEEELAKIKSLPREQRKEALVTFKENLARQREALAALRVFIERSIEFNHDVSRERLMEWVEKFSAQYGFDGRQRRISEQLIDRYFENRQKVLNIRQQFADDHKLVRELTGVNLDKNEKIRVSVGPMTIDIDADGFNSGRLYERVDKKPIIGFKYGGFASQSISNPPVYYVVVNQDKWIRWVGLLDPSGKTTRKHEYEHQKNKLFRAVFKHKKDLIVMAGYSGEQDPAIKKIILEDFFNERRKTALEQAKDEITACLLDRTFLRPRTQLADLFLNLNQPHDYLAYLRNRENFKDDPLYQETAQRMLVQEYRGIIQKAVDSYAELAHRGKYSTQEAIALLTDKPLEDWPKTIRRLLEQKEKRGG